MVGCFKILTLFLLLNLARAREENLWCYQCNTDLRNGHKSECNDPYTPGPSIDLISCPRNESHHCLKSVIFYQHILVTVRGCVPSREIDYYCQHLESLPQWSIQCHFCKSYGCNNQESIEPNSVYTLAFTAIILHFVSRQLSLHSM